jgi:hypothetical protein
MVKIAFHRDWKGALTQGGDMVRVIQVDFVGSIPKGVLRMTMVHLKYIFIRLLRERDVLRRRKSQVLSQKF